MQRRAVFLSYWGISSAALRDPALALVGPTRVNAVVIDVKDEFGKLSYDATFKNAKEWLKKVRDKGVYTIGRVVCFRDQALASRQSVWAVHTAAGQLYKDDQGTLWTDPFITEVRNHNLVIAEKAAELGFDEIQFDYVRFPDAKGLAFSQANTMANRIGAINGFLAEAKKRLAARKVLVAADVFGYILWNQGDTDIGQRLEDIVQHVDYVCPMLYPSGFQFGIPGARNAVAFPYEIVLQSLEQARKRTKLPGDRFRPWLQAFKDYQFDRRDFGPVQVAAQIKAAETFGANGWMLWNPQNLYGHAVPALK